MCDVYICQMECALSLIFVGFQISVEKFFIYYLTIALTTVAGAALAFTFSAMVSVFAVANLLVSLVFILYMVSNIWEHGYKNVKTLITSGTVCLIAVNSYYTCIIIHVCYIYIVCYWSPTSQATHDVHVTLYDIL